MTFPASAIIQEEKWSIDEPVRTSGPSLSGQTQLIAMPAAAWVATISLFIPNSAAQDWRHWVIRHRGGLVPDLIGPTLFRTDTLQYYSEEPGYSDGYDFSDGTGFVEHLNPPGPVTLVGAHSAGATALSLKKVAKTPLTAADWSVATYIGLASRLYQVTGITIDDDYEATLSIWPPLRADAADEAELDEVPVTKMRVIDPSAGWVPDFSARGVSRLSLDMIEDLSAATVMT